MNNANLGWLFYKDYFKDLVYDDFKIDNETDEALKQRLMQKYSDELDELGEKPRDKTQAKEWEQKRECIIFKNKCIIEEKVANITDIAIQAPEQPTIGNIQFEATTNYPGLLIGSGYTHELPNLNSQATLGFYFDYTTGLPVIPGSSIKGVLRNSFQYPEYIQELLSEKNIDININDIKKLELQIFGQENKKDNNKVIKGRDIFFDAVIISSAAGGKILDDDYITPHKNSKNKKDQNDNLIPNALCNPIPLRFIKVVGGVKFRFDFKLYDSKLNDNKVFKKEQKEILFKMILSDFGLGAKTNVGYGQLNISTTYIPDEDPIEKIFKEYDFNTANIVSAYNQGLKERVIAFKDAFQSKLIKLLEDELKNERKKQKRGKIEARIEKVKQI